MQQFSAWKLFTIDSSKFRKTIKIVFFTIFLDLVGFSLIFPLFPQLAKFYLENDSQDPILRFIFKIIEIIIGKTETATPEHLKVVLFGGLLGGFYSLLQFFAAPFWGSLSDKKGRRPVLLTTVFMMSISYLLWFISNSFTLLVFSRFLGGLMAGNLSTATAVVSDVTNETNRTKGMAFVGIAFATGFVFGPAIGGICSLVNLSNYFPSITFLTPFSFAALVAMIFSLINFAMIWFSFEETNLNRKVSESGRTSNPFSLFKPLSNRNLNLINLTYFFYIAAFSGMEFGLTFLAVERFHYTPMQNAYLFIFIGLILTIVQGGFIRRKAHLIGEKLLIQAGLILIIPGSLIVALTNHILFFYLGLGLMSLGTSFIIPCLTSVVTWFAPADQQGKVMGTYRSLGSLGRVFGPLWASFLSFALGTKWPYIWGILLIIIPILLISKIETPARSQKSN